jgi:hypothetical protein
MKFVTVSIYIPIMAEDGAESYNRADANSTGKTFTWGRLGPSGKSMPLVFCKHETDAILKPLPAVVQSWDEI